MAKDLHIQIIDPTQQRPGANFTFGFSRPIRVEGLQKLADQWLKLLLTPKGSHPWRRTEGTNFTYLLTGNAVDLDSVQTAVMEYIEDATEQMKNSQRQRPGLPLSEVLQAVNLLQFTRIGQNSFDIWVRIVNVERSTLPVLIPYVRLA